MVDGEEGVGRGHLSLWMVVRSEFGFALEERMSVPESGGVLCSLVVQY